MRFRRPLSATYSGLLLLGVAGCGGFGLLTVAFSCSVPNANQCYVSSTRSNGLIFRQPALYRPELYFSIADILAIMALLWGGLMVRAILLKPGQDRALDVALQSKLQQSARGAPLEPR